MDVKQLDILARTNEDMPTNLQWHETAYYQASRYLYRQYEENKKEYEFLIRLHNVEDMLKRLKAQGFNTALEQEILEEIDKVLR